MNNTFFFDNNKKGISFVEGNVHVQWSTVNLDMCDGDTERSMSSFWCEGPCFREKVIRILKSDRLSD